MAKDKDLPAELVKLHDQWIKSSLPYYDLVDGKVVKVPKTWEAIKAVLDKMERGDFRLWRTEDANCWLSTVFMWFDHGLARRGKPLVFESFYHDGTVGAVMDRYHTKEAAWKGHKALCKKYRLGEPEKDQTFVPRTHFPLMRDDATPT